MWLDDVVTFGLVNMENYFIYADNSDTLQISHSTFKTTRGNIVVKVDNTPVVMKNSNINASTESYGIFADNSSPIFLSNSVISGAFVTNVFTNDKQNSVGSPVTLEHTIIKNSLGSGVHTTGQMRILL